MGLNEETEIAALFALYDSHWNQTDFVSVAALWDESAPGVSYIGEEYAAPIVGWIELHRHWARVAARIREASMRSTPLNVDLLSDELAHVVVDCVWRFVGVESPTRHEGKTWVTAVLRRRAEGWRFVHYAEAPVYDPEGLSFPE